jgi:hypothetical protein
MIFFYFAYLVFLIEAFIKLFCMYLICENIIFIHLYFLCFI